MSQPFIWDGRVDMMMQVIKVNKMTQEIIWKDFETVRALITTLSMERREVLDGLWEINIVPHYNKLVEDFLREYI